MADLDVQTSAAGLAPVFVAADPLGDTYRNNSRPFLLLTLQSTTTLIVESPYDDLPDWEQQYGPGNSMTPQFDALRFNDTNGRLRFRFSDPSGVAVAVVQTQMVGFSDTEAIAGSLIQ